MTLDKAVSTALEEMEPDARLYVAFSGGLDSQVLLQLAFAFAVRKQIAITALHVNHGLSPQADHWQALCQSRCEELGIPLLSKTVDLGEAGSANLEQRARQLRYQWFTSLLGRNDVLLTGHHLDDQAETLLLRLMRASGSRGLAAIPACRTLGAGHLIRPFLNHSKSCLQSFADKLGLSWVEDESNQCLDFDRNYLRHQVIPSLLARWPEASRQLARSAMHCREDQELLDALADIDLCGVTTGKTTSIFSLMPAFDVQAFVGLPRARQRHLLQAVLRRLTGHSIAARKMHEWLRQLAACSPGGRNRLELESLNMVVFAQQIHFLRNLPDMSAIAYQWHPQTPLYIEELAISLRLECSNEAVGKGPLESVCLGSGDSLQVHWRSGGERVRLPGAVGSRALKKLLQEKKIAPWLRNSLPLVSYKGAIICSTALGAFSPALVDEEGRRLSIVLSDTFV